MHVDNPAIVYIDPENVPGQKGILCSCITDKDTSDKYAGCVWIVEKYKKSLQQENWTSTFISVKIRIIGGGGLRK